MLTIFLFEMVKNYTIMKNDITYFFRHVSLGAIDPDPIIFVKSESTGSGSA
jgi:hypothetical protein